MPFEMKYLADYYRGFTREITKFQWPDPFGSIHDARETLEGFLHEMERGEMLLFSVLSKHEEFLGSVEIHGLAGECPELGVWIIEPEQGKGYAYEALNAALDYAGAKYHRNSFFYEADIRNAASLSLLRKFEKQYEIVKQGLEKLTTDSGKELELQGYVLKAKKRSACMK